MTRVLTTEDQLKIIELARTRLQNVVKILENAIVTINSDDCSDDQRIIIIREKLDEALVALQGPKKTEDD